MRRCSNEPIILKKTFKCSNWIELEILRTELRPDKVLKSGDVWLADDQK